MKLNDEEDYISQLSTLEEKYNRLKTESVSENPDIGNIVVSQFVLLKETFSFAKKIILKMQGILSAVATIENSSSGIPARKKSMASSRVSVNVLVPRSESAFKDVFNLFKKENDVSSSQFPTKRIIVKSKSSCALKHNISHITSRKSLSHSIVPRPQTYKIKPSYYTERLFDNSYRKLSKYINNKS